MKERGNTTIVYIALQQGAKQKKKKTTKKKQQKKQTSKQTNKQKTPHKYRGNRPAGLFLTQVVNARSEVEFVKREERKPDLEGYNILQWIEKKFVKS